MLARVVSRNRCERTHASRQTSALHPSTCIFALPRAGSDCWKGLCRATATSAKVDPQHTAMAIPSSRLISRWLERTSMTVTRNLSVQVSTAAPAPAPQQRQQSGLRGSLQIVRFDCLPCVATDLLSTGFVCSTVCETRMLGGWRSPKRSTNTWARRSARGGLMACGHARMNGMWAFH